MPQLIWTQDALRGLQRCHRIPAPRNPAAASRTVRAMREGMRIVAANPGSGRPAYRMDPVFWESPIPFGDGGHVVHYRMDGDLVVVLTVRHQREPEIRVTDQ